MAAETINTTPRANCYLCETGGAPLYNGLQDRLYGVPGTWHLQRCPNRKCGLVWLDPMPHAADIGKLYPNYFTHGVAEQDGAESVLRDLESPLRRTALGLHYDYPELVGGFGQRWLARLLSLSAARRDRVGRRILWTRGDWRGRVLDVGCGSGKLLNSLHQLRWHCVGFEPDAAAVGTAREEYGLTVYASDLEEVIQAEEPFDLVTSSHVIEHLLDPIQDLTTYRQLLKPGGRIIVATPNFESLGSRWFQAAWQPLDPPRHLHLFSRTTLARCLEEAGFVIETFITSGASAKSVWRSSRIIQQEQTASPQQRAHPPAYAKRGSRPFAGLEQLALRWGVGEELVATARNPT